MSLDDPAHGEGRALLRELKPADYTVAALDTALELLRRIAADQVPALLADLAGAAGVSRSTAFRLLWTMERARFVRRDSGGGYLLGSALLDLGQAHGRQNPIAAVARVHVERVRDQTGETAALLVRHGRQRVCLVRAESVQEVRFTMRLGTLGPLWRGAGGRVLLAYLSADERRAMLMEQPERRRIEQDAADVLAAGCAMSVHDTEPDIWSLAWPVRDGSRSVVAALACAGPMQRRTTANIERCQALTKAAAAALSRELGHASL